MLCIRSRAPPPPTPPRGPCQSEEGVYQETMLFIRSRTPPTLPERHRQSEEGGIGILVMYHHSCPSHPSSKAPPPERGGHRDTM